MFGFALIGAVLIGGTLNQICLRQLTQHMSDSDSGSSPESESGADSLPELTDKQQEVLSNLPASCEALAQDLDKTESTIRDHISNVRDTGINIEYDRGAAQYFIADSREQKLRRISTKHKSQKTKEATGLIEVEESTLIRRLKRTEPLSAQPESDGSVTLCAGLGDLHFGDVVEKEYWDDEHGYVTRNVYDMDTAARAVEKFGENLLSIKEKFQPVYDFDDCYLFLMGDISTGEQVYSGQVHDIEAHLSDQTTRSVESLYQLSASLATEFDTVQIRGILGNHGKSRASASRGANTDLLTYRWLNDRLRASGHQNVNIGIGEAHHHLNTMIRDKWRCHVRHGQNCKEHIDETSYSQSIWRGWQAEHQFDIALKGHHHRPAYHKVMNKYPVLSTPSPKMGGEFASKIGSPDVSSEQDLGYLWFASDDDPIEMHRVVSDRL